MPQRVELADRYGAPYDADNPVHVSATLDGGATEAQMTTLIAHAAAIEAAVEDVTTPSPVKDALLTSTDLTRAFDDGSAAAEESLIAAVASQTTRVHRIVATAAAACNIELRDGSGGSVLRKLVFLAAGAYVLDFSSRPWAKTTANTALYWARSAAVACTIEVDYVTSA